MVLSDRGSDRITPQERIGRENLQAEVEITRMGAESIAGGRYRLERRLGRGGMASVYLGHDTELDRPVAVKLLDGTFVQDDAFRKRFVREARVAARLSHPNVVSVYDAGVDEAGPYIVMEHVEGENLAELLSRRGRLPPDEARGLALQAARGLGHAHDAGLVHRDVKPQNLIARGDGTLKVADFGIARAAEATALTEAGTVLGTAAYLSPEQALAEPVSAASDVYSLGAVLYELLSGRPPLHFESLADLAVDRRAEIAPVRELARETPRELEDVVMRCLARNPAYRPANGGELAGELAPREAAPTRPLPAKPRPAGQRVLWVLPAGLIAVAAVLLAVALRSGGSSPAGSTAITVQQPAVRPVPPGASAQEQARNIAAWLRQHTAGSRAAP
jgi:serine/threonine protein kinase